MLLNDFEAVLTLKNIIAGMNPEWMGVDDLEEIEYAAIDLKINLPEYDLESLYNSDYDSIAEIYEAYKSTVDELYTKIRQKIAAALGDE